MTASNVIRRVGIVTRVIFVGGMVFLVVINAQPWIELARRIVPTITTIPFLSTLVKIPYLGGWVQWATKEMVSLLGMILCGTIQIIEILPMLYQGKNKQLELLQAIAYGIEFLVCFLRFPPYEGGVAGFWDSFGTWDVQLIDWWNLVFFVVTMLGFEIVVKVSLIILQTTATPTAPRNQPPEDTQPRSRR